MTRAVAAFDPIPSRHPSATVAVLAVPTVPADATVVGVPVYADGAVPERQDFDRATLEAPVGANAFGTRLLADFAVNFRRPAA